MTEVYDIHQMSQDELVQLVLILQNRILTEAAERDMIVVRLSMLEAENAALRKVLAERIVGIITHTTYVRPVVAMDEEDEETESEGEPNDTKKDVFQA